VCRIARHEIVSPANLLYTVITSYAQNARTRRSIKACLQGRKNLERYSHNVIDDAESDFTLFDKTSPMTFPQDLFALVGGPEHPVAFVSSASRDASLYPVGMKKDGI